MFIVDNEFVEIYSKNIEILRIIKQNAENNKYNNICYITEKNARLKFSVFY